MPRNSIGDSIGDDGDGDGADDMFVCVHARVDVCILTSKYLSS